MSRKRKPLKRGEPIPAAPFVNWVNSLSGGQEALATRLGVSVRQVYRWQRSLDYRGWRTDFYRRRAVEDALEYAGVPLAVVYPVLAAAEDVDLEPDVHCPPCGETVTPINGECPWCDALVALPAAA